MRPWWRLQAAAAVRKSQKHDHKAAKAEVRTQALQVVVSAKLHAKQAKQVRFVPFSYQHHHMLS